MDPLLVFAAADLDTGGISIDRELPIAWLAAQLADVEVSAVGPGRISGRLSRSGADDVVVRADLRADVSVPCARCLKPAAIALRGELALLLHPGKVLPVPAQVVKREKGEKGEKGDGTVPSNGPATGGKPRGEGKAARGRAGDQGPGALAARGARLGRAVKVAGAGKLPSDRRGAIRVPEKLQEFEFTSEEADIDLYDGESVILDEFAREAFLLEMPNFPLCSEDCPGIPRVPADAGSAGSSPREGGAASEGSSESDGRPPGTKSLGDVLRVALAARTSPGTPKPGNPKKR